VTGRHARPRPAALSLALHPVRSVRRGVGYLGCLLVALAVLVGLTPLTWGEVWEGPRAAADGVLPSSAQCGGPELGGILGAAWHTGRAVRTVAEDGVSPQQARDGFLGAVEKAGELAGAFMAGTEDTPLPAAPSNPNAAVDVAAGCCASSGTLPAAYRQPGDTPAMTAARAALAQTDWRGEKLVVGVAVAGAESGGWNPKAANPKSDARGLWQVRVVLHRDRLHGEDWADPAVNARVAGELEEEAGGWSPWTAHSNGAFRAYLAQARTAVNDVLAVQGPRLPTKPVVLRASDSEVAAASEDCVTTPAGDTGGSDNSWGGYQNGRIPLSALTAVPGTTQYLRDDAADAFVAMSTAYAVANGTTIALTDGYRDYATQVRLYAEKPGLAAKPGTSNHGWGVAVDLGGGVQSFGTAQHEWMRANAERFGFVHPEWAQAGGSRPEPWHWEYHPSGGHAA